jgi:hypothetical protein
MSGSVLAGEGAPALGLLAAAALTGFDVLAVGLVAAYMRAPRSVLLDGAPAVLSGGGGAGVVGRSHAMSLPNAAHPTRGEEGHGRLDRRRHP